MGRSQWRGAPDDAGVSMPVPIDVIPSISSSSPASSSSSSSSSSWCSVQGSAVGGAGRPPRLLCILEDVFAARRLLLVIDLV